MSQAATTLPAAVTVIAEPKECPVCGVPLKGHPKCQGCGILVGLEHIAKESYPYRGRRLCAICLSRWQRMELLAGQVISWPRFLSLEQKKKEREKSHEAL